MAKKLDRKIIRFINDPSFRRWCLGEASPEQKQHWDSWISERSGRRKLARSAKRIVVALEKKRSRIEPDEKIIAWQELSERIYHTSKIKPFSTTHIPKKRPYTSWIATAAASIALLIISFLAVEFTDFIEIPPSTELQTQPEQITISTDYGKNKIIKFDSGTKIILNANSSVTHYKEWGQEDTINIHLEGEAYFDVAKRSADKGPFFQVETKDGRVNVLGTRFMVSTWDERTQVVLEEGSVAIDKKEAESNSVDAILKPSELAEFSQTTSDVNIFNVNTELFTSWTKGLFVFDRTSLLTVANRIEKTFGKEVVIADPGLLVKRVSGSIESDDLEVLTSALARTLQISVVATDRQIIFRDIILGNALNNQTANINGDRND